MSEYGGYMKKYRTFGLMIDLSRNAVMTVESLKNYLTMLSKMGYNMVMLYTEDTYEIEDEPYFGYLRGRYSKKELKEVDAFADSVGIELVPCIQTLAHLTTFIRWGKVPAEDTDCMLADEDRTYELIDKMFASCSECFRSRNIHMGMDEAWCIGRRAHLNKYGYEEPILILKRHLNRINEIAKKYGYEKPMIWSDMFFRPWNNGRYAGGSIGKKEVPKDVIASVPENIQLVYWAYEDNTDYGYDAMLYNHKQFNNPIWYAGGIYGWIGRTPLNNYSIGETKKALDACEKYKIKDILMTLWGNGGNECSRYTHLAALYHIIQYAKGNRDIEKIKRGFKRIVGADYDDFAALDLPNQPGSPELGKHNNNPSYYMLYSDYFVCHLDYTVKPGAGDDYKQYASILYEAAKRTRKYKSIFVSEALTCDILYHKYELGVKTRRAYQIGDKEALLSLAKESYTAIEKLIPKLIVSAREQWYSESKPYGFDLIERKLGGLLARTTSCKQRLIDYVNGKIDSIPELAEEILPYGKKEESIVTLGDDIYSTSART